MASSIPALAASLENVAARLRRLDAGHRARVAADDLRDLEEDEVVDESEGEKPKASVFFIAYTVDDVPDKTRRPLTFSFNGGPGSST